MSVRLTSALSAWSSAEWRTDSLEQLVDLGHQASSLHQAREAAHEETKKLNTELRRLLSEAKGGQGEGEDLRRRADALLAG